MGEYDPHGGRNAFRNNDEASMRRAMRSFTQSIDDEIGPPPELPESLDIDRMMKTSDTNETIIEMKQKVDPQLGETQKYKMAVPGPGHSEQEQELHKSLIRDEDDDEIAACAAIVPTSLDLCKKNQEDPSAEELRRAYDKTTRKRPTTPTSSCVLDGIAFIPHAGEHEEEPREKIKVSIPTSGARRATIAKMSADRDILDENPSYRGKAPPPPVVHRRSSVDWENFAEDEERLRLLEDSRKKREQQSDGGIKNELVFGSDGFNSEEDKNNPWKAGNENNGRTSKEIANDIEDGNNPWPAVREDEEKETNDANNSWIAPKEDENVIKNYEEPTKKETEVPNKARNEEQNAKITEQPEDSKEETIKRNNDEEGTCEASNNKDCKTAEDSVEDKKKPPESLQGNQDASRNKPMFRAPTVEITSPDAPHTGFFHDPPQTVTEEEHNDDDDDAPKFSEDMDEQRRQMQEFDPNAYPGYVWNYEKQEWEYDEQQGYDYSAYGGYEGYLEACKAYEQGDGSQAYSQEEYDKYYASVQGADAYQYTTEQNTQAQADPNAAAAYTQEDYDKYYASQYGQAGQEAEAYQNQYSTDHNNQYNQDHYDQQDPNAAAAYSQEDYDKYYASYYSQGVQGNDDATNQQGNYSTDHSNQYNQDASANNYEQYAQPDSNAAAAYTQEDYDKYYASYYSQGVQGNDDPANQQDNYSADAEQHNNYYSNYQPSYYQQSQEHEWQHFEPQKMEETERKQESKVEEEEKEEEEARPVQPARPPPARPAPPKANDVNEEAPSRPPPVSRPPPPRPQPAKNKEEKQEETEEDAWAQFKKMTEKVNNVVKNTEDTLKNLSESSATKDIKDESYFAEIGGSQGFVNEANQREIQRLENEKKAEKMQKKKLKQQGKKTASPPVDVEREDAMDRAAQELAIKLASMRTDIGDWKAPELEEKKEEMSAIPPRKKSSIKDVQQDSGGSLELPPHLAAQGQDSITPKGDLSPDDPILSAPRWADFDTSAPELPPSESGFFSNRDDATTVLEKKETDDPFAPQQSSLIDEAYDPFAVVSVEEAVAMAKAKAEQAAAADNDDDFYNERNSPALSTPTPEGGSPISQRPNRFEDDFKCANDEPPTPLYDEDDSEPLVDFQPKFDGDGWSLMVRHPIKKKSFMAERCWKPCFVKLHGSTLLVYNDKNDGTPIQELLLQATYSLSDTSLQAYDVYGKIHTVKLQYVVYREKVGIRPGQISRLVDGHVTKYGLPLEHSAQCTVLLKFGSLDANELHSFVTTVEDVLFKCQVARSGKPVYKQDEVQVHCYDEYSAMVDKTGAVSDQRARVRLFCLAFLTGSPVLEIGLNDRRRQGKEIVRRKDILPMYTERWIRFEALEFNSVVNRQEFEKEQVITLSPPDGCFFEVMRFRVRPPRNREKAMTVKSLMKIAGSKVEIRIEAMAAAQIQRTRGSDERRTIPCEDIAIRFPIPEAWIYLFREERHWGVGSIHSKKLRPGKVKNLKDRLLGAVQTSEANLIECAIGEAKYEHVYRALVWRIPRLPEKHHSAYKSHLLKCRFELSSFDLMPEEFLPRCDVEFTMPLATVSNTVVRSVSVEQHEDSDRVEKFVRYVAKYNYKVEIDYIQCADLDVDMNDPSVNPEAVDAPIPQLHQPAFDPASAQDTAGYRIDFNEQEIGRHRKDSSSSSDDEPDTHKMPIIQIDMKNYGY